MSLRVSEQGTPLVEQLEYLFNPRSVAVVGASEQYGKWGFEVFSRVLATSPHRKVFPVNERASEIFGLRAFRTVREIPEPVDLAAIVVPHQAILPVIEDCIKKEVKAAVIISAGFSESGEEGARLEKEMVRCAREGGLRLLGPNCMGHISTPSHLATMPFLPDMKRGHIGLISQSGNFGGYILLSGLEMGLGFSRFVSSGNEADLHLEDYLEYLAQDNETKVITAYIEGLREPRRFLRLAQEITRRKPLVVMKAGRTKGGAKAARSHSAALAGREEIYDAAFRQAGIIRVETVTELLEVASALLHLPLPRGKRVGIITGGGGFGVFATDACEKLGLEMASLSPRTVERINAILPSYWSRSNPVDLIGAPPSVTYPCLWAMLEDEGIDAILALTAIGRTTGVARLIEGVPASKQQEFQRLQEALEAEELKNLDRAIEAMNRYQKPILITLVLTEIRRRSKPYHKLLENGIPVYPFPESAARALAHLVNYREYLNSIGGKGS